MGPLTGGGHYIYYFHVDYNVIVGPCRVAYVIGNVRVIPSIGKYLVNTLNGSATPR